ncbi:unnamed protein product [Sphagnum troendelagicum]|uniref:Protein SQS1 n=1 Tax=Sphagnum troendelagicum TaxID=128251 RepID=A0ABP0U7Y6_9BRYO
MVRGRGRGRGGGRGRQGGRDQTSGGSGQARQGNGGARQNGFVGGGALGNWEATPNLASVNSRKGRTQGGVNGSASGRQQTSNGRPVSKRKHPIARPAQNTFTSVGYSYGDRDDARSEGNATFLGPAADNLDVEGFLKFKKDEDVAAVETMNVEPQGHHSAVQLEQKTAGGKTSSVSHKSKKKMHNSRTPNSKISSGFLRIGGVRVWTDQGSTCENEHLDEEEDTSGLSRNAYRGSEDSSSVSEESNSDPISSDVSDEMAEDYLSNVGVGLGSLDASWLLRDKLFEHVPIEDMVLQGLEDERDTTHASSASELSGFSGQSSSPGLYSCLVLSSNLISSRLGLYGHLARFWFQSQWQTWSMSSITGEKKRQRKEQIAAKRQIRAQCRGFDLAAVNAALEEVVTKSVDIFAFEPMEDRDRAQIHKLASIYRLKSSSQGSGKRRFVVVTHTRHTSLPTGIDKERLLFMLGQGAEVGMPDSSRAMTSKGHKMVKKSNGHGQRSTEKRGQGTTAYASKPMSFVSSGIIRSEEESPSLVVTSGFPLGSHALGVTEKGERSSKEAAGLTEIKDIAVVASAIGTFEAHTRGFGSRMMSKMGFQEGQGLGKDGQGIASPVEAVKRPKSLGLGAYAATT